MPDVATVLHPQLDATLDWVGMANMQMPILFDAGDGSAHRSSAKVDVFVNLTRPDQRGIHMSRLYLLVDDHLGSRALDAATLASLLNALLDSHRDMADRARIGIRFEHLIRRPALRSGNSGWRAYPVSIQACLDAEGLHIQIGTEVVYSSTCPASAALSRQLIQQQFAKDFHPDMPLEHTAVLAWLGSETGIVATPHAQRSVARLRVRYAVDAPLNIIALLDRVETALGTPVQTAVKREDEQAFARANGSNLMFCEDAARRIYRALDADNTIACFNVQVEHLESLHPHDAVACASKSQL
ncbi:GTP cyclohydrolase I FolE2 [Dyella monticola]|uniref:GTP cyclohydrolase FolE2 n=1 Tax=Dyella monticola TaxID=1927958 RepID=A0A370X6C1_9GAMM|nr:GTP cyclohydrolase FolE2 [Dyella monticola]RDS83918.1 GTP cyclohydrolase I FolE2 [Dyella monticola]